MQTPSHDIGLFYLVKISHFKRSVYIRDTVLNYLRSGFKYVGTFVPVLDFENCLFWGLTYISKPMSHMSLLKFNSTSDARHPKNDAILACGPHFYHY